MAFLTATSAVADKITIAVLGDSLVQGYGLPEEQGFVPQLQRWLDDQGAEVQLINAGVSGDTTAGGLARIDWTLAAQPDGLIVSLGGNDALRAIDPAQSRSNLDGILSTAAQGQIPVLLVGILAPKNYGENYSHAFNTIYPDLSVKYHVPLYPNFLGTLLAYADRSFALTEFFQADALHPNAKGVALIVEDIGPFVLKLANDSIP